MAVWNQMTCGQQGCSKHSSKSSAFVSKILSAERCLEKVMCSFSLGTPVDSVQAFWYVRFRFSFVRWRIHEKMWPFSLLLVCFRQKWEHFCAKRQIASSTTISVVCAQLELDVPKCKAEKKFSPLKWHLLDWLKFARGNDDNQIPRWIPKYFGAGDEILGVVWWPSAKGVQRCFSHLLHPYWAHRNLLFVCQIWTMALY